MRECVHDCVCSGRDIREEKKEHIFLSPWVERAICC